MERNRIVEEMARAICRRAGHDPDETQAERAIAMGVAPPKSQFDAEQKRWQDYAGMARDALSVACEAIMAEGNRRSELHRSQQREQLECGDRQFAATLGCEAAAIESFTAFVRSLAGNSDR